MRAFNNKILPLRYSIFYIDVIGRSIKISTGTSCFSDDNGKIPKFQALAVRSTSGIRYSIQRTLSVLSNCFASTSPPSRVAPVCNVFNSDVDFPETYSTLQFGYNKNDYGVVFSFFFPDGGLRVAILRYGKLLIGVEGFCRLLTTEKSQSNDHCI